MAALRYASPTKSGQNRHKSLATVTVALVEKVIDLSAFRPIEPCQNEIKWATYDKRRVWLSEDNSIANTSW